MEDELSIHSKICMPNNPGENINSCNDVVLFLSKSDLQSSSLVMNSPNLGDFNSQYLGTGVALVLTFYLLGFGLGQIIKMVNLR